MDLIIRSTGIHDFCRVCLKPSIQLFSCRTKLFFRNTSTTIFDILNVISPQKVIDPPYYPISLCFTCKEFVQSTVILKTKYEETTEILNTLFSVYEKKRPLKKKTRNILPLCSVQSAIDCSEGIWIKEKILEDLPNSKNNKKEIVSNNVSNLEEDSSFEHNNEDIQDIYCSESVSGESETNANSDTERVIKDPDDFNNYDTNLVLESKIVQEHNEQYNGDNDDEEEIATQKIRISTNRTSLKLVRKRLHEQEYLCPVCRKQFSSPNVLRRHASSHRILRKYYHKFLKVPKNTKIFAQSRDTNTIFNQNKILHVCPFCKEKNSIENFRGHIRNHFRLGDFACTQCDRVFRKINHLRTHVTFVHLEELPYQCNECDKGFTKKYNYDCHMLTHQKRPEELPHKCEFCGKAYHNLYLLRRHRVGHTQQVSYWAMHRVNRCKICLRTFESLDELKTHTLANNCQPVPKFLKQIRKKCFRKSGLRVPSSRLQLCALCGVSVMNVKNHMRNKHTPKNAKKELCSVCGVSVLNITQHMKRHKPKTLWKCTLCAKMLGTKLTLMNHMLLHTGERPFHCIYCEKRFKDKHTKDVHVRTHEGIKRHFCPVCSKGFIEKSYMMKHLKTVHK